MGEGWIKPGDVVVDPFGGIGSTGLVGASLGLRVVCVELESEFYRMANSYDCPGMSKPEWLRWFNRFRKNPDICPECHGQAQGWYKQHTGIIPCSEPHHYVGNFERNRKAFECGHFGHSYQPVMIQGDSRQLSEIIGRAECIVGSPPFAEAQTGGGIAKKGYHNESQRKGVFDLVGKRSYMPENHGQTPGQLGAMKPGSVDAVVSSPPFSQSTQVNNNPKDMTAGKAQWAGGVDSAARVKQDYADMNTPGNIASLPPGEVSAIISSPPYEGSMTTPNKSNDLCPHDSTKRYERKYGDAQGQLGQQQGETFWSAAKIIISECYKILKPQGFAIWVVKAFVRKGKLVDFPGDWQRLCESQGFQTVCLHHAMLYKEPATMIMDWAKKQRKERVSFFRRNANNKAAWRNYWKTLPQESHEIWITKATEKLTKAKLCRILQKAQELAFMDSGEVHWDWNDDVRIDYETVLCMRKV